MTHQFHAPIEQLLAALEDVAAADPTLRLSDARRVLEEVDVRLDVDSYRYVLRVARADPAVLELVREQVACGALHTSGTRVRGIKRIREVSASSLYDAVRAFDELVDEMRALPAVI